MKKEMTSTSYFQTLNIVYYAQMLMLIAFGIVVVFLKPDDLPADDEFGITLQYVLFALFVGGVAGSFLIPRVVLNNINHSADLKVKLGKYLPTAIIRAACLEVPGLFACVVTFLTGNTLYLLTVALLLILFFFYRPTKSLVSEELKLSIGERRRLENPNEIVAELEQQGD